MRVGIDGLAATGKDTIAAHLLKILNKIRTDYGFEHDPWVAVDSGALYRAVCLYISSDNVKESLGFDLNEVDRVPAEKVGQLDEIISSMRIDSEFQESVTISTERYGTIKFEDDAIKSNEAGIMAGKLGACGPIRHSFVELEQRLSETHPYILLIGRDSYHKVFADDTEAVGLYIYVDLDKRIERRSNDFGVEPAIVEIDLLKRDNRDCSIDGANCPRTITNAISRGYNIVDNSGELSDALYNALKIVTDNIYCQKIDDASLKNFVSCINSLKLNI